MTREMQDQLKAEKRGIKAANKALKVYAAAISDAFTMLTSDDSPLPEFRDEFRDRQREIAMQVLSGQVSMRDAKAQCKEFRDRLLRAAWCYILQDERAKGAFDALGSLTYHTIRRDAILNGETVATFNA